MDSKVAFFLHHRFTSLFIELFTFYCSKHRKHWPWHDKVTCFIFDRQDAAAMPPRIDMSQTRVQAFITAGLFVHVPMSVPMCAFLLPEA